jgi:hypothetical protein
MTDEIGRDRILTTLAILMGLMAFSNFIKPLTQALQPESTAGFVFFGARLHGRANAIVGPLFGVLLAYYAYGAWTSQRWVVPIAVFYAGYVIVNLVLFTLRMPAADQPPWYGMLAYAAVAVGVSSGGAFYLLTRRERLH